MTTELTARELAIVTGLADGLSREQIARRLKISRATACRHADRAFKKLRAGTAAQAVYAACRLGLLPVDGPAHREAQQYDPPPAPDDPHRYALGAGGFRTFPRQEIKP